MQIAECRLNVVSRPASIEGFPQAQPASYGAHLPGRQDHAQ